MRSLAEHDLDSLSQCIDFEKLRNSNLTAESLKANPNEVYDYKKFWGVLGQVAGIFIDLSKCHETSIGAENSRLVLSLLKLNPEIAGWFNNLFCSSLCAAWSAYECLSKDLWTSAVNSSQALAHRACFAKERQDDSKKISLDILFQNKLDLRDKMGLILAPRFDFTSEEGIRLAYDAALVEKQVEKSKRNDRLYLIEQTRHVIQHRAGIIDVQFSKKTGSKLEIGSTLTVTADELSESINTVIGAGCILLTQVNEALSSTNID